MHYYLTALGIITIIFLLCFLYGLRAAKKNKPLKQSDFEVVNETYLCDGCYFDINDDCHKPIEFDYCSSDYRADNQSVIFKRK